jgi:hypothetical protein
MDRLMDGWMDGWMERGIKKRKEGKEGKKKEIDWQVEDR